MKQLLETCCAASHQDSDLVWVDDDFLVAHSVGSWIELPLWIPEDDPIARGFFDFRSDRAVSKGLRFRPLEDTVRETAQWALSRSPDHAWRGGLKKAREEELLAKWLRRS